MRKKILAFMLAVALGLSLVACSRNQSSSDGTSKAGMNEDASIEYNADEFLPVGSVVLLKGGNKRIMICGRIQAQAGSDIIYDYSACYYPEGIVDPKSMFFFNRDAIETVYFRGYEDQDELDYRHNVLEPLGELEIRNGVIVPKEN